MLEGEQSEEFDEDAELIMPGFGRLFAARMRIGTFPIFVITPFFLPSTSQQVEQCSLRTRGSGSFDSSRISQPASLKGLRMISDHKGGETDRMTHHNFKFDSGASTDIQ